MQYVQGYAWDFVVVKNGYDGITTRKSSEIARVFDETELKN